MTVAIAGSDNVSIALALAHVGIPVQFCPDDAHDATRLRAVCAKGGVRLRDRLAGDLNLGGDGLALSWHAHATDGLQITQGVQGGVLIETFGKAGDHQGVIRLAVTLGCNVVQLVKGPPLTSVYKAHVSAACEQLLLTGRTPMDIDCALQDAGFALGPFAMQDRDGVDVALSERKVVFDWQGMHAGLPLFARAVGEGRLGCKVGVGWHRYPGGDGPVEDPLVEDMAAEEARFLGHTRRDLTDEACVAEVMSAVQGVRQTANGMGYTHEILAVVERHMFGFESSVS